jgi:hypothetical protein
MVQQKGRMSIARYYSMRLRSRLMAGDEPAWLKRHIRRDYIVRCVLSFVAWADRAKLREMKRTARRRGLVLDHIIPITHPDVCGLTVPENLRMVPPLVNAAKSNKWTPDQIDMLPAEPPPHQLRLGLNGRIAA